MLRLSKCFATFIASVRPNIRVHSQMLAEIVFGRETLFAVVTVERPFPGVSPFMNLEDKSTFLNY